MAQKLNDRIVKALAIPDRGNRIAYDADVKGFGVRITAAGGRAFVLNYRRKDGRERRWTIGSFPDWSTGAARDEARRLKREIDLGADPVGAHQGERSSPTVADLCDRFEAEYLPRRREWTRKGYRQQIATDIRPAIGRLKVASVTYTDIDRLHREIGKRAPIHANRVLALLSKMFSLAIRWHWRADANPCRGVERNAEQARYRYLVGDELARLTKALAEHRDQQAANIVRLLLLTGARRGEVLAAQWNQFDLENGIWSKPASSTKQARDHIVPLSAPARQLLAALYEARDGSGYLFPHPLGGHCRDIKRAWAAICRAAGIEGLRAHDLRHSYASALAGAGFSLPVIGALLGHSTPTTTARYSHLFDDPLRVATERAGAILTGKPSAEIVPIKGARPPLK
jgi:integrase